MAENPYVNKIEANNQTLIDLTGDTATAGDVLEGRTLHLASGAPATGTYKPSAEIEARLEATVGHSSKNLLPITLESGTYTEGGANLTYTVDKAAGTITLNGTTRTSGAGYIVVYEDTNGEISGNLYVSGGYSDNCYVRVYDYTNGGYVLNWNGESSIGSRGENDSDKETLISGHRNAVRLRFTANQTFTNVVIRPMIRSGSISDDTFEPYVTPTDEKKQDKPVELDPTILTWNIADIQSKYTQLQIVCECIYTGVTPNMGLYDIITIPTVIFGRAANADKILAFTSTMTMNQFDTVLFTESSGNVSAYIETSTAHGTRTIIQIIGIPK